MRTTAKDALAHSRISTTSDIYVHTNEVPVEVAEMVGHEINFTMTAPQESELVQLREGRLDVVSKIKKGR
jgi:hypothetical protein